MKVRYMIMSLAAAMTLTSCNDWLMEMPAGSQTIDEYYVSGAVCAPVVVGCYAPMMWQFRGGTYIDEWFIGDICSDDALKGGQFKAEDANLLDMENFRVNADNDFLLNYYHTQYVGISRCNRAIHDIAMVKPDEHMDMSLQARYIAEAKCLRAFYYLRLVRVFGSVPYVTEILTGSDQLTYQRAPLEEIYAGIIKDLKDAEIFLWNKSDYPAEELGHVTKGTAQALLMKTYLTGHQFLENPYENAKKWGEALVASGQYSLCENYWDNFSLAGENGPESVFEIQYTNDPTGDYGGGGTRGAFTVRQQRCRSSKYTGGNAGWGYNRPSQDLYNEYEAGDPRRDMTIDVLTEAEIDNPQVDFYEGIVKTVSLKYAMMTDGTGGIPYALDASNNPRDPINTKEIRYADALLMYAEACVECGDLQTAKDMLEKVRARARGGNPDVLPPFPYGNYSDNADDLRNAIRHERRVELAMEGHRWFDLTRWGVAYEVMTAFGQTEEVQAIYYDVLQPFRKGVHEIFPIPAEEIRLAGLQQNPGY